MKIEKDTVVTIKYKVSDAQGKLIEASPEPMAYLHGGYENTLPRSRKRSMARKRATRPC